MAHRLFAFLRNVTMLKRETPVYMYIVLNLRMVLQ